MRKIHRTNVSLNLTNTFTKNKNANKKQISFQVTNENGYMMNFQAGTKE